MMSGCALQIEGLAIRFGEVQVLRGVSAELTTSSVTAFIGPNGAGKTTLFHAITGDVRPDEGTVTLLGEPITGLPPWRVARRGLGKLFQDVRLFENLSVLDNVLLALQSPSEQSAWASLALAPFYHRQSQSQLEEAVQFLEKVGFKPPFDQPAGLLSYGNKKLAALARLMAGRFQVLLLDEPTAGVEPATVERLASLLQGLRDEGITIGLIEHNFAFVQAVAERTYLLRDGWVQDQGHTRDVLSRDENREILIGL